jgi:hypothetical protein
MCVPRLHGVGSKQGNLGRKSRPETCNMKWFRQSDLARRKQSSLNKHGYQVGQSGGWGNHIYALAQTNKMTYTKQTQQTPARPDALL